MAGGSSMEEKCARFFALLMSSALSEWSLIVVLLINAVLAYIATGFARFCRLPPPCILCSRLDYIIAGSERKKFYQSLFCHDHKMEISSMIYCHCHRKLADSRTMCETCLLSAAVSDTAAGKGSRPVFGLDHKDDDEVVPDDRKEDDLDGDDKLDLADLGTTRCCSCCFESVSFRRLMKARKVMRGNINGGVGNRRARKTAEKTMDSPAAHAGYSELKMSSMSESEGTISGGEGEEDGGYSSAPSGRVKDTKEETATTRTRSQNPLHMEDKVPQRLIHPNPETNSKPEEEASISKTEEVDWDNGDEKKDKSEDSSERMIEQLPRQDGVSGSTNLKGVDGDGRMSSASTGASSDQSMSDPVEAMGGDTVAHNNSIKIALAKNGVTESPRFGKLIGGKAQDDLRTLLTQKSLRMLDLTWNELATSPRFQQTNEGNTSIALQNIAKKLIEMEMNGSSLDGDMEGENSVEKLKQQVEQERKSNSALYRDLEEERNASAVAANEAMTMINRLQEEKAAIQMEALQYQRMMEDQSEFDQEAIENLNDLLTDREKELLDLQAELESYRRSPNDSNEALAKEKSLDRVMSEGMIAAEVGTDYAVKDVLLGFEEEKTEIAECLRRLEEKVLNIKNRDEQKPGDESDGASTNQVESLAAENYGDSRTAATCLQMEREIFKVSERLCALEADREFLGHAINVLRYGSDGVRLVEEIACYLDELRRYLMPPANRVEDQIHQCS